MSIKDPRLKEVAPKTISGIKLSLTKYNESVLDITSNFSELSIFESINSPFLYGHIVLVDNSSMLSTFPFIGQEKLRVEFDRGGKSVEMDFRVIGVYDVKGQLDGVGTYGLRLSSEKQTRNAISLFSKSYRGNGADIISGIHSEYLKSEVDLKVKAKRDYNIVFPYMTPLAAINMIQKNVMAEDGTPMFLFENLYTRKTVLNSYKQMLEQKPVFHIEPRQATNTNAVGASTRDIQELEGQVYSEAIDGQWNTHKQLAAGAYGAQVTSIDISAHTAEITDFDFREHAPPIAKDWISSFYAFDDVRVNSIRSTRNYIQYTNGAAFCLDNGTIDHPNLTGGSEEVLNRAIINSYMSRMDSTVVNIYMNSVPAIAAGVTVEYTKQRFSPKFNKDEDPTDKVNSGIYLVSSVRHYIRNNEYTMSIELIRDGMGEEADLYNNETPDFGSPPRKRQSVLGDLLPPLIED
jgi:hypothetical protein